MNYTPAIPPSVRTKLYLAYSVLGVVLGAVQVGFATVEAPFPPWLKITLAVFVFLGGAIGYTAASHTPAGTNELQLNEAGEVGVVTLVAIVLILVGALGLFGVLSLLVVSIVALVSGIVLLLLGWSGRW